MIKSLMAAVAAVALVGASSAAAESWDMASSSPEANFHTKNIRMFIEDVDKATGGAFKITLHPAQALFKSAELKRAVRTGQVPMGDLFLYKYGNEDPIYEASSIPFVAGTYTKAANLWKMTRPELEKKLAAQGIRLLYGVPWPIQGFYTSKSVASSADFKGMKFRVYSSMTARMAEEMGANPVQIASSEIPQAFATGLAQAMYTSPQTGINSQAWDFAKYFTKVGGNLSMNSVVVNEKAFKKLSAASQKALLDAAAKAEKRGWRMSQDLTDEQIGVLKSKGMVIAEPSSAFVAELDAIGQKLAKEWGKNAGPIGGKVLTLF